jgi:hypothetical protein
MRIGETSVMDRETQRRVVREQRAGYDWLARMNLEEARRATFEDRVHAFNLILSMARAFDLKPGLQDDADVAERWRKIRARYDANAR